MAVTSSSLQEAVGCRRTDVSQLVGILVSIHDTLSFLSGHYLIRYVVLSDTRLIRVAYSPSQRRDSLCWCDRSF